MKILVKKRKDLEGIAEMLEEYSDIVNTLIDMEKAHIWNREKNPELPESLYPLVVVLLKKTADGLVETDDEFFDQWSLSPNTENYDWNANDLYWHLWEEFMG